jgi:hypothetical protein
MEEIAPWAVARNPMREGKRKEKTERWGDGE